MVKRKPTGKAACGRDYELFWGGAHARTRSTAGRAILKLFRKTVDTLVASAIHLLRLGMPDR